VRGQKPSLTTATGAAPTASSSSVKVRPRVGREPSTSKNCRDTEASSIRHRVSPTLTVTVLVAYCAIAAKARLWSRRSSKVGSENCAGCGTHLWRFGAVRHRATV